ncbi:VOC family protein [Actinomycetota bacterium]
MRVDHVSYAAESDGLQATAERLAAKLDAQTFDGGVHPRFGTRNVIIPLGHERYLEVVEALEHPASYRAPFGQAVRKRSEDGGGWLGWVIAVEDIKPLEERLGRDAVDADRTLPDGTQLQWKQLGVNGLITDPQLPFFVQWLTTDRHPSTQRADNGIVINHLTIAGDPERVHEWIGEPANTTSSVIDFEFVAPHGTPGLLSVTFTDGKGRTVTV